MIKFGPCRLSMPLYRSLCINTLNLLKCDYKLCRFKERSADDAHGLSLSLCLSSPPLFSPSWPPLLHTSACRFDLSLLSSRHKHRGIPWDYGSTRYYLQRTYVTFRTAYYCDYRRIMRRPSRSTIYYWIAIIRIDRTSMRLDVHYIHAVVENITRIKFLCMRKTSNFISNVMLELFWSKS